MWCCDYREPQKLDYPDLAEDIAIEARLALALTEEIKELDERIAVMLERADPAGIIRSAPGVGAITGAAILGRLGDPARFSSLAAARSFTGLVPPLDASGQAGRHGGPTKRGDAVLREALFIAADHARRLDPSLARYHRLMTEAGKHHTSAICHIAPALLTRIIACWRTGERYVLHDVDERAVDSLEARAIIAARYTVPADVPLARSASSDHRERVAEVRGRGAPHRLTRSPVTLSPRGLDIDWDLNGTNYKRHYDATVEGLGGRHKRTRPYRPQTNGKAERVIRTLLDEWAYRRPYATNRERADALRVFVDFYNCRRPHAALGGRSPLDAVNNIPGDHS